MQRVLILLDVQNMYHSARVHSRADELGIRVRVKHENIHDLVLQALHLDPEDSVELVAYAYVVQSRRSEGSKLFKVLESLGFTLKYKIYGEDLEGISGSVAGDMQLDMVEKAGQFDRIVSISGNGILIPAFQSIRRNHPKVKTYVMAFPGTVHSQYFVDEGVVDEVFYLNDDMVVKMGDKHGATQENQER